MGKFMRKSKLAGDVAVMELPQSSLGVRTRAKTLALQRLQQSASGGSYLQLRSRKLEKTSLLTGGHDHESKRQSVGLDNGVRNPSRSCRTRASSRLMVSSKLVEEFEVDKMKNGDESLQSGYGGDGKMEAYVAENSSNFGGRDRSSRESTPCSFIRDSGTVGTPGSTSSASTPVKISARTRSTVDRIMPTPKEVEDFFAGAEQQQHRQFIEKYNFDPVKEKPLHGQYGWVRDDL